MTRTLLEQNILDAQGNVRATTSIHVYQTGTTTPIGDTIYTASVGGTTKANPLTSDSDGYIFGWLDSPGTSVPGYVDLVWTEGATTRRKPIRLDYAPSQIQLTVGGPSFQVRSYGAVGDNSTIDTIAVQDMGNAMLTAGGGRGHFSAGTYVVDDTENPTTHQEGLWNYGDSDSGGYHFSGDGMGVSVLKISPSLSGALNPMFGALGRGSGNNLRAGPITFSNLSIVADARPTVAVIPVDFWQGQYVRFQNCHFKNLTGMLTFTRCYNVIIDGCVFESCGFAASGYPTVLMQQHDEGGSVLGVCQYCSITNSYFLDNDAEAVYWSQNDSCKMIGNYFDTSTSQATNLVTWSDVTNSMFIGNHASGGADDNLLISSLGESSANTILGNSFSGALGGTDGTGFGVHVAAENADQVQTFNVADANQFGYPDDNTGGSVVIGEYRALAPAGNFSSILGPANRSQDLVTYDVSPVPLWENVIFTVSSTVTPKAALRAYFRYQPGVSPLTINAPIEANPGQPLFFQIYNTTGGNLTINWNAVFQKPTEAVLADTKTRTYGFLTYDGTNFVQFFVGADF